MKTPEQHAEAIAEQVYVIRDYLVHLKEIIRGQDELLGAHSDLRDFLAEASGEWEQMQWNKLGQLIREAGDIEFDI